jgi:hypothetical protein
MKSLENRKKGLPVLTISLFITAAIILATSAIMSTNTYAQTSSLECGKVLTDSPQGNQLGWNPDGELTTFSILDDCYDDATSIVLVNTRDGATQEPWNFEVCNVDFNGEDPQAGPFFEVNCNNAPFDGSQLRYVISNSPLEVIGAETQLATDSQKRQTNATQTPLQ